MLDVSHILDPHPMGPMCWQIRHAGARESLAIIVVDARVRMVTTVARVTGDCQIEAPVTVEVGGEGIVYRVTRQDRPPSPRESFGAHERNLRMLARSGRLAA